jgi:thiamine biosynthesis lipoprotein ApbE
MNVGMGAHVTRLAMGTVMTHKAFGPRAEECLTSVCAEVDRLEKNLSRFLPESDISRINRSADSASLPLVQISAGMWSRWGQSRMAVPGISASSIPGKKTI